MLKRSRFILLALLIGYLVVSDHSWEAQVQAQTTSSTCQSPTNLIVNCGFEQPALGPGAEALPPDGTTPWTYSYSPGYYQSVGVTSNGSLFTHATMNAPEGTQVGFFHGVSKISQVFNTPYGAGTTDPYTLTFSAAQRGLDSVSQPGSTVGNDLQILIDGTSLLVNAADDTTIFKPTGLTYQLMTTKPFTLAPGSHTLVFSALNTAGIAASGNNSYAYAYDNTVFIDQVDMVDQGQTASIYTSAVLNDNPIGYWKLGESTGNSTARDSSGHGYNGTYNGGVILGEPGAINGNPDTALRFDGSSGAVELSQYGVALQPAGQLSVEAWIKTTGGINGANEMIMRSRDNGYVFAVQTSTGKAFFTVNTSDPANQQATGVSALTAVPVNDGNWHYIAGTYDGTSVKIYLDGVLSGSANTSGNLNFTNSTEITIGSDGHNSVWHFNGTLDEVALYGTALSSTRIQNHTSAGGLGVGTGNPLPLLIPIDGLQPGFPATPYPYAASAITVNPYPPVINQPVTLGANLQNPTNSAVTLTSVDFAISGYGLGLVWQPVGSVQNIIIPAATTINGLLKVGTVHPTIQWTPPFSGHHCVQVTLHFADGRVQFLQRNLDIIGFTTGSPVQSIFQVGNPTSTATTINLQPSILGPITAGWTAVLDQPVLNVGPGEIVTVVLTITPPPGAAAGSAVAVNVSGLVNGGLIGGVSVNVVVGTVLPAPTLDSIVAGGYIPGALKISGHTIPHGHVVCRHKNGGDVWEVDADDTGYWELNIFPGGDGEDYLYLEASGGGSVSTITGTGGGSGIRVLVDGSGAYPDIKWTGGGGVGDVWLGEGGVSITAILGGGAGQGYKIFYSWDGDEIQDWTSIDGGPCGCVPDGVIRFHKIGRHNFHYYVVDRYGHKGPIRTRVFKSKAPLTITSVKLAPGVYSTITGGAIGTGISYTLSEPGNVTIRVYDGKGGKLIRTIVTDGSRGSGVIIGDGWDGKDDGGVIVGNCGCHITLEGMDNTGNLAAGGEGDVLVDSLPPSIGITGVSEGGTYTGSATPACTIDDLPTTGRQDPVSGVNDSKTVILLDGNPYTCGTPITGAGPHGLTISATDNAGNSAAQKTLKFVVKQPTSITLVAPSYPDGVLIAVDPNGNAPLKAVVSDSTTGKLLAGEEVTLKLGVQSCTATTNSVGIATCNVLVAMLGPNTPVSAAFPGDTGYLPSNTAGKTALVFAYPGSGQFVLGDLTVEAANSSTIVNFWGAQWWQNNSLSLGGNSSNQYPNSGPGAFKGFDNNSTLPTCGSKWTSNPGNSSKPPATIPGYMAVIVSSTVTKNGSSITGDIKQIVIVKTDPTYEGNPGQAGTGNIVAKLCS